MRSFGLLVAVIAMLLCAFEARAADSVFTMSVTSPDAVEQPSTETAPQLSSSYKHGNAGIATGLIIHVTGYLLILTGGIVAGAAPGSFAGLAIAITGCQFAAIGGLISTMGHGASHRRALAAGLSPDTLYKRRSSALNAVSTGLLVAGLGMSIASIATESFGLALGGAIVSTGAGVVSVANVFGPQMKWGAELAGASTMGVAPALGMRASPSGRLQPTLGVAGVF